MNVIIKKNGEYVNRIIAESLEVAELMYGNTFDIFEEIIALPENPILNSEMNGKIYCPVCHYIMPEDSGQCSQCNIIL